MEPAGGHRISPAAVGHACSSAKGGEHPRLQEDFLPTLTKSLTERESAPISLELVEGERPVVGGACWMVQGVLPAERRFWLCFASDAITSGKTIALAESGSDPSLLESFLIDEKRINLALLESRLLQRLNGQKWFGGN